MELSDPVKSVLPVELIVRFRFPPLPATVLPKVTAPAVADTVTLVPSVTGLLNVTAPEVEMVALFSAIEYPAPAVKLMAPAVREMLAPTVMGPCAAFTMKSPLHVPNAGAAVNVTAASAPCAFSVNEFEFEPVMVEVAFHCIPLSCVTPEFWMMTLPSASCALRVEMPSVSAPPAVF